MGKQVVSHRRMLPVVPLVALIMVFQILFAVACDTRAPSPAPAPSTFTVATTAPDDADPMAAKLAREASAHRAAPPAPLPEPVASVATPASVASAAPPSSQPFTGPLPPPEGRRWQDAGVLVLEQLTEEDALTEAASLRWEFSHNGAPAWTNAVDAIHVYEKLWVVRISAVDITEAKRVCAWLDRPKPTARSWLDANARRVCKFTPRPTLTSKTEYEVLSRTSG
jgi:hypothetical protein